jgi:hypothetical protein
VFTNATATFYRTGDSFGADGLKTKGAAQILAAGVSCVFSQSRSKRSFNTEGLKEFVKSSPALIAHDTSFDLAPGDFAEVACAGKTFTVKINDAVLTQGIAECHWECDVEFVKLPCAA